MKPDSSEFDDTDVKRRNYKTSRKRNMDCIERKMYCTRSNENKYVDNFGQVEFLWNNDVEKPGYCQCKHCLPKTEQKYCCTNKRQGKCCDETTCNNTNIQVTQSKLAIMKGKILPCLSSIFCRSHTKRMGHKGEPVKSFMKDNSCQVYSINCSHKKKRKLKKGHDFSVQSNSTDDDIDHTPVLLKPQTNVPLLQDKSMKYSSESSGYGSSSLSLETAKTRMKQVIEKELKKYYLKKQYIRRNKEQQAPSKNYIKIFSTAQTSQTKDLQNQFNNLGCDAMPSNSSVFWEYLVDRINKKYQNNNRGGVLKSCHCTNSQQCPSMADRNLRTPPAKESSNQDQCPQSSLPCSYKNSPMTNKPMKTSDPKLQQTKKENPDKVHCECPSNVPASTPTIPTSLAPGTPKLTSRPGEDVKRPCQEPHEEVKASLQEKYKGEVLCIHNPPCILINGCLNLPPVKGQFAPTTWPVTQETSYHVESCGTSNAIIEQACQYQPPNMEYIQYDLQVMEQQMKEKITQSICNHDPPCEIVRCCYKPNFDPKLDNSCIHVPMCPKMAECLLGDSNTGSKACQHQPKCPELLVCKEKSGKTFVTACTDNVGAQVKPTTKIECRHQPPCIRIPKCLGKLMCDGYVPYDAIPDCVHQPTCEMIPACCRKSAKMNRLFRMAGIRRKSKTPRSLEGDR
ncbi:hypothetical protein evm_001616 [Chilo suppressalis]|nr:hypothetical protein evm_001616 [Chilo suppressalis]